MNNDSECKSRIEERNESFVRIICERWVSLPPNENYYLLHGVVLGFILGCYDHPVDYDYVVDHELIDEIEALRDLTSYKW